MNASAHIRIEQECKLFILLLLALEYLLEPLTMLLDFTRHCTDEFIRIPRNLGKPLFP